MPRRHARPPEPALEQAGLTAAALDRYPHQMSGGQLQRVMVAMAIACQPRILIADEPTTALDVTVQARILNLLRALADQGMGILLVSHDLGVVAQVADRVAVMYCGSIVETGAVQQMYSDTAHPYTRGLMQASPTMGMGRSLPHSIPGTVPDFRDRPAGCGFSNRCPRAQAICRAGPVAQQSLHPGHVVACHFPFLPADTTAQP